MENKVHFQNKSNERLVGYLHEPTQKSSKGVVLGHCFSCNKHIKIIRALCDSLAAHGFLVLRFDFSGNGESQGKFEESTYTKQVSDLLSAIDFICSQGVESLGISGHSMGAAVSILASSDKRVKSLCVYACASYAGRVKEIFDKNTVENIYKNGSGKVKVLGREYTLTKDFFEDANNHDIKQSLIDYKRPFCVIHGTADTIIPVSSAEELYTVATGMKEKHLLDGEDHMFMQDTQKAVDIGVRWFEKTL